MKTPESASSDHKSWETFCRARVEYLRVLGDVVAAGFIRKDTEHPVFCGCIDWHSSVHGAYALLAAARLIGQPRWVEIVDETFTPDCLEAELVSLKQGNLDHERPYGYAWFLKQANEREQGWGKKDLLPLTTEIAARLEHWMSSLPAGEVIRHCQQREYGNFSWVLLNLWNWSQWTANQVLSEKLVTFTRMWIVLLDEALPASYDSVTDEFFAASLQRTRAILTILPREESSTWLKAFYLNGCFLPPIQDAHSPHSAGLNFSRAWAFWDLYAYTEDERYRSLYVDHIVTHIQLPKYWRDDYQKHGHWVPQFGIYAIALSMENIKTQ